MAPLELWCFLMMPTSQSSFTGQLSELWESSSVSLIVAETETLLWRHKLRVEFLYWKCYFGPSIDTKLEMDLCDNDGNYWGRVIDGDMRRIRKRKQSFVSNWNCSIISKDFVD